MEQKEVLVLGAGVGQVPLMDAVHSHGYKVLTVSPKGSYPGLTIADDVIYADIRDKELVYAKVCNRPLAAVVTDQLDEGVPSVAWLSAKLGLRGNDYEVTRLFKDKYLMRKAAEKLGINVPRFARVRAVDDVDAIDLEYPLVVKPVDRASSLGVYLAHNRDELVEYLPQSMACSPNGCIVEEFVAGREWAIDAIVHDGCVTNLLIGHRDNFNVPGSFLPCATVYRDARSADTDLEQELLMLNKRLIEGFGLSFGLTETEMIYDERRESVFLVETAARGGGFFVSSDLIPAATQFNAVDAYVRDALGDWDGEISVNKGAACYFGFILPPGKIVSISGVDEALRIPGVLDAKLGNVEVGMEVKPARDKYSRKGPFIVAGETKDDLYRIREEIKQVFDVKVLMKNGALGGVIWQ